MAEQEVNRLFLTKLTPTRPNAILFNRGEEIQSDLNFGYLRYEVLFQIKVL